MKFEMDLSEGLVRKLRALNILVGGDPKDLPVYVAGLVERVVTDEIVAHARGEDAPEGPPQPIYQVNLSVPAFNAGSGRIPAGAAVSRAAPPQADPEDLSGISAGLGDDDIEIEGETDPMAMVPKAGTGAHNTHALSDEQLDAEQTGGAPAPGKANPERRPEEEFGDILGVEHPPVPEKNRGKRRVDVRRVTGFTGAERNAF